MKQISIPAADGFPIAATVFGESNSGPVAMISSGTGVPQLFYQKFAQYLARHGFTVVTYDYRGIGQSRIAPIRSHTGTMRQWAQLDAQAVSEWLAQTHPQRPLCALGHSFGGQAFAFMEGNGRFSRVAMVASQSGYWKLFDRLARAKTFLLWHVFAPALLPLLGYFPSSKFGLGADLPAGVMRDWAGWGRHPKYLMREFDRGQPNRFLDIQCPILVLGISDDDIAPPRAMASLRSYMPTQDLLHRRIDATKVQGGAIGHFGFFRDRHEDTLWKPMKAFLAGEERDPFLPLPAQ